MIYLTQWKCPSNHTALAVAWDEDEMHRDDAVQQGEDVFTRGLLNRWCGICGRFGVAGAPIELHVEHGQTAFRTTGEAQPALRTLEAQNLLSRAMIDKAREARN